MFYVIEPLSQRGPIIHNRFMTEEEAKRIAKDMAGRHLNREYLVVKAVYQVSTEPPAPVFKEQTFS